MATFPEAPFTSDRNDFQTDGGGIDYLGLRWVSLTLLAEELLPGVNNQTRDFGIFCLATWIPWKFRKLSNNQSDFTLAKFRGFEEAIGVAIAYSLQPGSASMERFGEPNAKIGVQQKLTLPSLLGFEHVKRTRATSIYAAPLYGPSLKFLNFIAGNARSEDGTATEIPMTATNAAAETLATMVEQKIGESDHIEKLLSADSEPITQEALDELSLHGLNPAEYRGADENAIRAFLGQLVPDDVENGRTKTARLLIETLRQQSGLTLEEVRATWHTGLFADGNPLVLENSELAEHLTKWSVFQARQYQRYIIELMMRAFEKSLVHHHTLAAITDACLSETPFEATSTFNAIFNDEAEKVTKAITDQDRSADWNQKVHGGHSSYEWIEEDDVMSDCERALRMLARWMLRVTGWTDDEARVTLLSLGGEDRVSMRWFVDWVNQRRNWTLVNLVSDLLEQLVFGQHVRVALSRFDGKSQKLRFLLDDHGIVLAKAMVDSPGKAIPGWTQDRLDAFVALLCDVGVLAWSEDDCLGLGRRSEWVTTS